MVIDTASRACSVALFDNVECIASRHEIIGRGHAERLVPMIAELPERGLADIISVNVGPGSFTGIRVGISAAKALGLAWNVPCEGYSGLALLAAIARRTIGSDMAVDVAINGGHGEYFVQAFGPSGEALNASQSLPPEDAAMVSEARYIAGDAAARLVLARQGTTAIEVECHADAWNLIADASPLPASPCYVRGPDAQVPGTR